MTRSEHLHELSAALQRRGFADTFLVDRKELLHMVERLARTATTVGFGGSVTTRTLKLPELCEQIGLRVLDHWQVPAADRDHVRKAQLTADLFITAVNAVTSDGILVNADGVGNRVAASIYGPGHVIWVVTPNKIVPDVDAAIRRIQETATPQNAHRLNIQTPCSATGKCNNCLSDSRLDKVFTLFHYKPTGTPHTVFLLNEPLGY